MILSHLPPLDLLVVQRVNRTCRDIVKDTTKFQVKLFMKKVSPGGDNQWENKPGADGLRWNPFLVHYGRRRNTEPGSHTYCIRIQRKLLQKHHRPEASWKRMFLSYPTRPDLHVYLENHFPTPMYITSRFSSEELAEYHLRHGNCCQPLEGERMEFLMKVDRVCSEIGRTSKRHTIVLVANKSCH